MSDNKPSSITAIQREVELLQELLKLREEMKSASITVNRFEAGCGITTVYNGCTIVGESKKKASKPASTSDINTSNLTGNSSSNDTTVEVEPPPPEENTRPQTRNNAPPPPPESSTSINTPPPPPAEF